MVLSNKKLKQKLRSLLAESLAAAESGKPPPQDAAGAEGGLEQQLQSLKGLLSSRNQKKSGSSSSRGRKRKKPSSSSPPEEDSKPVVEEREETQEGEDGEIGVSICPEKKKKKRKIEEGSVKAAESTDENKQQPEKKKNDEKKKNNKKKKKKKKVKNKIKEKCEEKEQNDGTGNEGVNELINEKMVVEAAKADGSEEPGDATRRVYVGGIPYYSTEDDIRSFFEGCGTVMEVDCMRFPESGKFRGIAILTFKTEAAAKRALALDGADMGGLYLKIQPYKATRSHKSDFAPQIVAGYNRIYMGNLSWDITEDDLRKLFSDCKISSIRFGEDKSTGEFKGYAHVDFSDTPSLAIALKLDQTVVCGRPVRITCAVPKKGTERNATSMPTTKRMDSNMSLGNEEKKAQANDEPVSKSVNGTTSTGSAKKKKKRQTCYECGVPGHLSSACPRKKVAEAVGSGGIS